MDKPVYYKAERFFPAKEYECFSKILNRKEIVTFDVLCRNVEEKGIAYTEYLCDWNYGVTDWKELLTMPLKQSEQIIACFKNPIQSREFHKLEDEFEFCGYDLSDTGVFISAITNCGGEFEKVIPYDKLNQFGLINDHSETFKCRELLEQFYPNEEHAYCDVFELWRRL